MGNLGKSKEDYLETILILSSRLGEVLSVDVARYMNFSKPSVSNAVKLLTKDGYLERYPNGSLHLTEEGNKIAKSIYERHRFFTEQLIGIGVSTKQAEQDACKIEHIISEESFQILKKALNNKKGQERVDVD